MTKTPIVVAARFLAGQIGWLRHATEQGQAWAPGASTIAELGQLEQEDA